MKEKTKEKFYITTAIPYANAKPHIGHAYEALLADVVAPEGVDILALTHGEDHNLPVAQIVKTRGAASEDNEADEEDGAESEE